MFEELAKVADSVSTMTIESLVDTLKEKKSFLLSRDVERYVRFVGFDKGVLSINLEELHPKELIKNLNDFFIQSKFNIKVIRSSEKGDDTLEQKKKALFQQQLMEVSQNPILKEILECFRNSVVENIEDL